MPAFDIAILGSGFAASVLALVMQRLDQSVVLLERGRHPRFAIGESSTPIADQILLDLAMDFELPELARLARYETARKIPEITVGCKRGFSYFFHSSGAPSPRPLLVPASPDQASADSHWQRASVDAFLANLAVHHGVTLHQEVDVQGAVYTGNQWQLDWQCLEQQKQSTARFLIDATGSPGTLDNLLGQSRSTRPLETRNGCVFGHFECVPDWEAVWQEWHLDSGKHSFPAQHSALHQVVEDGWLWHLGFDDQVASLGWVLPGTGADLLRSLKEANEPDSTIAWWNHRWENYPSLKTLYQNLRPVRPLTVVPKLARLVQPAAGPGWLSLPAAVGFIDPLHSTGIAHAMTAVQKLTQTWVREKEWSPAFLQRYSDKLLREFWLLDQMIAMAYDGLGDPDKWEAATMVYFAGAIGFEENRNVRRAAGDAADSAPDFLLANDPRWLERVVRARQLLKRTRPPAEGWLTAIHQILGPYNTAGLADPECHGIYRYTTAQK